MNDKSKICFIGTASQSKDFLNETQSTLLFAKKCKKIKFKPNINIEKPKEIPNEEILYKYKDEVYF